MNKKDIIMSKYANSRIPLSRRSLFGTALAGISLSAVPRVLFASTPNKATITAAAFDGNSFIFSGNILSRSDDGAPLRTLPPPEGGAILTLATHPDRPGRIIAGLASGGVALSEDGGQTWEARSQGLPDETVLAITIAAVQPDTIFAAIKDDGLWKSEDVGVSWKFVMDRPWLADAEQDPLTLASVDLETGMGGIWIYAGTEAGLSRVPDCFCRWQDIQPGNAMDALVTGDAPPSQFPLPLGEPIHALVSAMSAPEILYAALPSGIWTSDNSGVVWTRLVQGAASAVAVHHTNPLHIIAAFGSGLNESRDGGISWTAITVA